MEFQTEPQKACYEKIGPWLKEIFGEFAHPRQDRPVYAVMVGSAMVNVAVFPWGDDDAVVCAYSYVVTKVELTPDLMKDLLQKNLQMRFGAFGVDGDGDIVFSHSIVGSSCDKSELKASVMAVLVTADKHDDEIVGRWGGQRALDRSA
jgi:hypothetical protein